MPYYQKVYLPKIVEYKESKTPPSFQIVEIYGRYNIFKMDDWYYVFLSNSVTIDTNNNFIIGFRRRSISEMRTFLQHKIEEDEMLLQACIIKAGEHVKKKIIKGVCVFDLLSCEEYIIESNNMKEAAKELGISVTKFKKLMSGDVVSDYIVVN